MNTPLHIIFMGTPAFAVPALEAVLRAGHKVVAVYTQPPRPAGRGQKERPSLVHLLAEKEGLPVFTPTSLKDPQVQETFQGHRADVAVVAAYGLLLPKAILQACPHGCLNIHPSLLPRWRGAAPLQRAIMAGDTESGVCIMQMESGLDTGPVILTKRSKIPQDMTAGEWHDEAARDGAMLLLAALGQLQAGSLSAKPQPEEGVMHAPKISKSEARINWRKTAQEIHNLVRGLSPYPGAFCLWEGESIKILRSQVAMESGVRGEPGKLLEGEKLLVACGQGVIELLEVQRPGRKAMKAEDMLRGFSFPAGAVLY